MEHAGDLRSTQAQEWVSEEQSADWEVCVVQISKLVQRNHSFKVMIAHIENIIRHTHAHSHFWETRGDNGTSRLAYTSRQESKDFTGASVTPRNCDVNCA